MTHEWGQPLEPTNEPVHPRLYAGQQPQPPLPPQPPFPMFAGSAHWHGPTPAPRRSRRWLPLALAGVLVATSTVVGVAIGRVAWSPGEPTTRAAAAPATTQPLATEPPVVPGTDTPALPSDPSTPDPSAPSNGDTTPGDSSGNSSGSAAGGAAGGGPTDTATIARNVDPGVVDIDTVLGYGSAQAAGTGMVLTADGIVLTNNHVISGATKISVTDVGNGKTYAATVLGYDRSRDIAVLQVTNASGLRTVTPATTAVKRGAVVVGVGNAGGRGGTPSYAGGVVTDVNQSITASDASNGSSEKLTGLIETNAAIEAGDSGGPLVNAQGQVVGIDTAASATFGFSRGAAQGYAIPIAKALAIAHQIVAGTSSATVHIGQTGMLGVQVTAARVSATATGLGIVGVVKGGPAESAGLTAGDVITSLDGHTVTTYDALSAVMLTEKATATVRVGYVSSTGRHTATVHLTVGPPL